jgi:hypothetical protein
VRRGVWTRGGWSFTLSCVFAGQPEPIAALLLRAKELAISPYSPTLRKAAAAVDDCGAVASLLEAAAAPRTAAALVAGLQTVSSMYAAHEPTYPAVAAAKDLLKRLEVGECLELLLWLRTSGSLTDTIQKAIFLWALLVPLFFCVCARWRVCAMCALAQVEEPALALLLHALQTKKQSDLTRAIDAAEAADAAFAANAAEVRTQQRAPWLQHGQAERRVTSSFPKGGARARACFFKSHPPPVPRTRRGCARQRSSAKPPP